MRKSKIDISISYDLRAIIEELQGLWYLSSPILGPGTLHNFVRGLIFSEKMLQVISDNCDYYYADWGQIVDERTGNYLSKECDIIIYKGKPRRKWGEKAIKFVVVESAAAKLVIQCGTDVTSVSKEHKEYPKNIKNFVPEVWYLAERYWGSKNQYNVIKNKLKRLGYNKFFALYRIYEKKGERHIEPNYRGWDEFIKSIRSLR